MAIDQAAVVRKVRQLVGTVDGIAAAYSAADSDDNRLPLALNALPAALVLPGNTIAYLLNGGQHRHTYELRVQVLEQGADPGIEAANVAPMPDRVLGVILENVGLGGVCNSIVFKRSAGLQGFDYEGVGHSGYELVFEVSEAAVVAPAYGS